MLEKVCQVMPSVRPFQLKSYCIASEFVDGLAFVVVADGAVFRLEEKPVRFSVHDGITAAVLCFGADGLLTAGEDGAVCLVRSNGDVRSLARLDGQWITGLASGPQGLNAWSAGRRIQLWSDDSLMESEHSDTVEALAFSPDGALGVAGRDGVTLYASADIGKQVELRWAGVHRDLAFSPDGRFVVTTMQEPALQAWRLTDGRPIQLRGYTRRVKSLSWSPDSRWLATSGGPGVILWPFASDSGPMGTMPSLLGYRPDSVVTAVACHPKESVIAAGFHDGHVTATHTVADRTVNLPATGTAAISCLRWDEQGDRLLFGSEAGECGVFLF